MACSAAPDATGVEDAVDDSFLDGKADSVLGIEEGSGEASGILFLASILTADELRVHVGLAPNVARAIASRAATLPMGYFNTLRELDAVPRVGRRVFDRLADFAAREGFARTCGDGADYHPWSEVCDGNDRCPADCGEARCGDGVLDQWEECDDGNDDDDDGCSARCRLPRRYYNGAGENKVITADTYIYGEGHSPDYALLRHTWKVVLTRPSRIQVKNLDIGAYEHAAVSGPTDTTVMRMGAALVGGHSSGVQVAGYCLKWATGDECGFGTTTSVYPPGEYQLSVTANRLDARYTYAIYGGIVRLIPPACGDWLVDGGETCDDGNTVNGDGCSATCALEVPFSEHEPNDDVDQANDATGQARLAGAAPYTDVDLFVVDVPASEATTLTVGGACAGTWGAPATATFFSLDGGLFLAQFPCGRFDASWAEQLTPLLGKRLLVVMDGDQYTLSFETP